MKPKEVELLKRIGQQVRYYRRLKNLTQEQLGEQASVCHKYLGEIERGNKNIGLLVIFRLAKALQVPLADLVNCSTAQADPQQKYIRAIIQLLGDQTPDDLKRMLQILNLYLRRPT